MIDVTKLLKIRKSNVVIYLINAEMKNMAESSELNTRMMKISLMVIIFEISGLCSMNGEIYVYT